MKAASLVLFFFCTANCKSKNSDSRILGGNYAAAGQFPFQAAIFYEDQFFCTGNILNENYILTAAHCVSNITHVWVALEQNSVPFLCQIFRIDKLHVVVGTNTWYYGGVTVNISKSIPHENFTKKLLNDLALLLLEKPLKFTKLIQPIKLLTKEVKRLKNVTISGWGRVWTNGPFSDSLKYNAAVVLSADECKRTMNVTFPGQICLGHAIRTGSCFVSSNSFSIWNKMSLLIFLRVTLVVLQRMKASYLE